MKRKKYDIFISYRRKNSSNIELLYEDILKKFKNIFFDQDIIDIGENFEDKILIALENSMIFLPILTINTCKEFNERKEKRSADWIVKELLFAKKLNIPIIPIILYGKCDSMMVDILLNEQLDKCIPQEISFLSSLQFYKIRCERQERKNDILGLEDKILKILNKNIEQKNIQIRQKKGLLSHSSLKKNTNVLKVCDSSLIVIKSILISWNIEEYAHEKGLDVFPVSYTWSDNILDDLDKGLLDLAIYNTEQACSYVNSKKTSILVLNNFGHSMCGNNFFVLSKDYTREDIDFTSKKAFLNSIKGATLGLPFNSDIHTNAHRAFDVTDEELASYVELIDVPTDHGIEMFNYIKNLVLLTGQNTRFQAKYSNKIHEILNTNDLPEDTKQYFYNKSSNSLVVNRNSFDKNDLTKIGNRLMKNFLRSWDNPMGFQNNLEKLIDIYSPSMNSREEAEFVIKEIIFETYMFGELQNK